MVGRVALIDAPIWLIARCAGKKFAINAKKKENILVWFSYKLFQFPFKTQATGRTCSRSTWKPSTIYIKQQPRKKAQAYGKSHFKVNILTCHKEDFPNATRETIFGICQAVTVYNITYMAGKCGSNKKFKFQI